MNTFFELRSISPKGDASCFSEGLGVVWTPIRYTCLRSANAALRRANGEPELIEPGCCLVVFKITEDEIIPPVEPRAKLGPVTLASLDEKIEPGP